MKEGKEDSFINLPNFTIYCFLTIRLIVIQQSQKMGVEVFSELQEKQLLLKMENLFDSTKHILFSRAGFTDKLVNEAALRDDLTLVGPREFENALINKC